MALVKEARGSCPPNVGVWLGGVEMIPTPGWLRLLGRLALAVQSTFWVGRAKFRFWIRGSVAV